MWSPLNVLKTLGKKLWKVSFAEFWTLIKGLWQLGSSYWSVDFILPYISHPSNYRVAMETQEPHNYNRCEKKLPSSHWRRQNGIGSPPTTPFAEHCPRLTCLASPWRLPQASLFLFDLRQNSLSKDNFFSWGTCQKFSVAMFNVVAVWSDLYLFRLL